MCNNFPSIGTQLFELSTLTWQKLPPRLVVQWLPHLRPGSGPSAERLLTVEEGAQLLHEVVEVHSPPAVEGRPQK